MIKQNEKEYNLEKAQQKLDENSYDVFKFYAQQTMWNSKGNMKLPEFIKNNFNYEQVLQVKLNYYNKNIPRGGITTIDIDDFLKDKDLRNLVDKVEEENLMKKGELNFRSTKLILQEMMSSDKNKAEKLANSYFNKNYHKAIWYQPFTDPDNKQIGVERLVDFATRFNLPKYKQEYIKRIQEKLNQN